MQTLHCHLVCCCPSGTKWLQRSILHRKHSIRQLQRSLLGCSPLTNACLPFNLKHTRQVVRASLCASRRLGWNIMGEGTILSSA